MDKQEIVAGLYGIRAGLSVISEDSDKIAASKQSAQKQQNTYDQTIKEISYVKEELKSTNNDLKTYQELIEDDNKTIERQKAVHSSQKKNLWAALPIAGAAVIVLFIGGYILDVIFTLFTMGSDANSVLGLLGGPDNPTNDKFFVTLTVILIISGLIGIFTAYKIYSSNASGTAFDLNKSYSSLNKNQKQFNDILNNKKTLEAKLTRTLSKEESCRAETKKIIAKETANQREITAHAEVVYSGLKKTYSSLLMEQDWCNIDLLIFYFLTGRADTMKEALLLVDKERQTQRIVEAVNRASLEIRSSIREAAIELGNILEYNFDKLNSNIKAVAAGVSSLHYGISSLNRNVSELNATNAQILKTSELNAALVAKAEKNSDELVGELRYLRAKFQESNVIKM